MIFISTRAAVVVIAGLVAAAPISASAESLAGQVGDQKHKTYFRNSKGPCKEAYQQYVKASGHSAYAQTHVGYRIEGVFCGRAYNAPSQKEAEKRALANCASVFTKYKVKTA